MISRLIKTDKDYEKALSRIEGFIVCVFRCASVAKTIFFTHSQYSNDY